jgi:hypothetical protein
MTATGSESIKDFLSTAGPCITIVSSAEGLPAALKAVRKTLTAAKQNPDKLLRGADDAVPKKNGRSGIAILSAPGFMRVIPVGAGVKPIVKVADRFDLRTLLAIDAAGQPFYVLALSQKRTRILECTQHSSQEVPFPAGFPQSLQEFKQTEQPDHVLDNRSSPGPDVGAMKGVMFGTSTDREKKDEYLAHFFVSVDRAVNTALANRRNPLVAAAVESELALYRRVNTYATLVEPGVHGAPDGLEGGEIHKRALEIIQSRAEPAIAEALGEFDKKVGTGRASVRIQDIVAAAFEGRVSHFLFQENAHYEGSYDPMRQRVKHGEETEDLVDAAAYQTIVHGGEARIVCGSAMPNGVPVCALFRYPATRAA